MSIETMTKLATTTLGTSTATVTFSNIPQTYTDLKVLISGRTTGTSGRSYIVFSFNSSTGVYDRIWAAGYDGGQTTSARTTSETYGFFGTVPDANATTSTFGNAQFYITNYTSNNLKSYTIDAVAENNSTGTYMLTLVAGSWDNTSALTSITFYAVGDGSISSPTGSFLTNSTFTLYGVKAARTAIGNSIKATGGNISFDGTYVVHSFYSSGTFTPTAPILADYLVVAGGGGGGHEAGGGGGGGGYRYFTSQPLTAQAYTVTVGAGGTGGSSGSRGGAGGTSTFNSTSSSGGGGGGSNPGTNAGQSGGSGGGSRSNSNSSGGAGNAGSYSPVEGYAGGSTTGSTGSGGGGGSSEVGGTGASTSFGGTGGAGTANSISGSSVYYAGGGGGGTNVASGDTNASGGLGGGGLGGKSNGGQTAGTANTGGGGGGQPGTVVGSAQPGGSGIVIIRYKA